MASFATLRERVVPRAVPQYRDRPNCRSDDHAERPPEAIEKKGGSSAGISSVCRYDNVPTVR